MLLAQISTRITRINKQDLGLQPIKEKINILIRLIQSYTKGEYRVIPWTVVVSVLASFLYFINPFDLIPDFAPIVGFTDDFSILLWVYNSMQTEIDKFLLWEKTQLRAE